MSTISSTRPFANTLITSAFLIVESRCATTIIVQFFSCNISLITFWISSSFLPSKEAVASSSIKILGLRLFLASALAMASLCLWPPLTWQPLRPRVRVRLDWSLTSYTSWALAFLINCVSCSSVTLVFSPTLMLSDMVSSNRRESWPTYPTLCNIEDVWKSLISLPPKSILPFCWL